MVLLFIKKKTLELLHMKMKILKLKENNIAFISISTLSNKIREYWENTFSLDNDLILRRPMIK